MKTKLQEAPLTLAQRKDFGLPSQKKYPMPDRKHVFLAIAYFNHCKPEDEKELAGNIMKYMKKFKISSVSLSPSNRFRNYLKESFPEVIISEQDKEFDDMFQDMLEIYDSLSKEEKYWMGDKFMDSSASVFREVSYIGKVPAGFCELYDVEKLGGNDDEVIIECAVCPKYRGLGIASAHIDSAIAWFFQHPEFEKIVYLIRKGNVPSKRLCDSKGFKFIYSEKDHDVYFFVRRNVPLTENLDFSYEDLIRNAR